jgi:hypothetical protein
LKSVSPELQKIVFKLNLRLFCRVLKYGWEAELCLFGLQKTIADLFQIISAEEALP